MSELKHVGRVRATGRKCLVAYRTLPGDAYSCLIIPTESLPDSYHDSLINLVESNAAQESYEFAEALARTTFPDGSTMLPSLHVKGLLVKVGTDAIDMTPTTSVSIMLSELNQLIAEQRGVAIDDLSLKPSETEKRAETAKNETVAQETVVEKTNLTSENLTPEEQAKEYRSKADKLAKEAAAFRRMAEELVPTKKSK